MKKLSCNNGDIFGEWTIIDNTPITKSGHTYVKAKCSCGTEQLLCLSDLVHGRTSKCKKCVAKYRRIPIKSGDKYKSWTVLTETKHDNRGALLYLCQCECGTTRWFQPNELINPDKCFECPSCAQKKRANKMMIDNGKIGDLNKTRYTKLKRSAEKRNIEFSVSLEYLWNLFKSQDQICAITGDYINSIDDASLDRIDSTKGYVEGNIQWVTKQANVSKHIMSMEELYEFCKKVLKHANQQLN